MADGITYPSVTVNILAYNRREELRLTLQKITQELDYPADRLEIIVVDNGSQDGTSEMVTAEFPLVRLITVPKNEGIAGWNHGFEAGKGDYFLVLDDDCYMSGDSLKLALQAAQRHSADLVSFQVTTPYFEGYDFRAIYNPGLLAFWGCSVLISRRAIERLDGFDPNIFVWAHEVEFTIRLFDAGLTHLYLPEVVSYHLKRPSAATLEPPAKLTITKRPQRSFAGEGYFEKTNRANVSYVVGKLLRLPHALAILLNLVTDSLMMLYYYPFSGVVSLVRANLAGFALGLRHRQPVSWEVSRFYRKHFVDYANPVLLLRKRPRRLRFSAERPEYYPSSETALQIG